MPTLAAHLVDLLEIVGQFVAIDDDLTLLVLFQPVDAADHRRFAGARRAGDDDAFSTHDLEVDIAQDVEITVPLVHIDDLDRNIGSETVILERSAARISSAVAFSAVMA
jgi:bifunctional DNase/RNase